MSSRKKVLIVVSLFLVTSVVVWIGSTPEAFALGSNYRGPFKGRVVDQDTNEPIEGAVVFVEWDIQHAWRGQTFFDAKEVLTDKDGNFSIGKNWSFLPWRNLVMDSNVIIFKAGYGNVGLHWTILKKLKEQPNTLSFEERKKYGPSAYAETRFEAELPVFRLKKLKTDKERWQNLSEMLLPQPEEYKPRLLQKEMAVEEESIRRSQIGGPSK